MATESLADRIRDGIHRRGTMSMTDIIDRAIALGHTKRQALEALQHVHKYKDISAKTTGDTVTYTVTQIKQAKPELMRWRPSPEQRAVMDKELEDYWTLCPFVTDAERTARIEKHDCTKCDCEACNANKQYYMKPTLYQFWLKDQERAFLKTI
jgi:hypothetical protein